MASISLKQSGSGFYGYATGNTTYGYYNVTFIYDAATRSGTTISVTNAAIKMVNPSTKYTTNTIYVDSVTINGDNVSISGSANGGTSNHTWNTSKKDITFEAAKSKNAVTVTMKGHRTGQSASAQVLTGTLSIPYGTYSITYNANGGTGAPSAQTKTHGTAITLRTGTPTRTGYDFVRWDTKKDDSGTNYAAGASYTANANATLYAQWKLKTYKVTYNANGGSGAPSAQTKTHGTALTLSTSVPTRDGYNFKGWATSSSGSVAYAAGASYTTNSAVTLYAKWELKTYAISYNANGGSGAPSKQTKTHGTALTLSSDKPSKTGYTFASWNTAANGSGTKYNSGASYTANSAVTLYAQWTENYLEISHYSNGATTYNGSTAALNAVGAGKNVIVGKYKHYYDNVYDNGLCNYHSGGTFGMLREGYTNVGKWGTSTSGGTTVSHSTSFDSGQAIAQYFGKTLVSGNATLNLYAQWQIITYAITYNANGGSGAPASQTKSYGAVLKLTTSVPSRAGYDFVNWNTKVDGSGTSYDPGDPLAANANAALTLYAQWKLKTYTISYNANGGSGAPEGQTKTYGTALTLSSATPTRAGHDFLGWNTKSDGSGTNYAPKASYTANSAATLYAIWQAHTYTVTYNANGGAGAPQDQTKTYGVTLKFSSNKPTRTDYAFIGWNTKADGSGTTYASGASYTTNAAVTLYAQWSQTLSKCAAPQNLQILEVDRNKLKLQCTVGADGVNNTATGVTFLIWLGTNPTENPKATMCRTREGAAGSTVATNISFENMTGQLLNKYFGSSIVGSIYIKAVTEGAAGEDYYSSEAGPAIYEFTWQEPLVPIQIIEPAMEGAITGVEGTYSFAWKLEEQTAGIPIYSYQIRIYDETANKFISESTTNRNGSTGDIQTLAIDTRDFTPEHIYRFYIKAIRSTTSSADPETISGPLLIKRIEKLPTPSLNITDASELPTTRIYEDDFSSKTFINKGTGAAFEISWSEAVAEGNKLDHYALSILDVSTNEHLVKDKKIYNNKFCVPAAMLETLSSDLNRLSISVQAISTYGASYSSYPAEIGIKCLNASAGTYVEVSEGYLQPIRRRAIAFIRVYDPNTAEGYTWKVAQEAFARDTSNDWQVCDIDYEVLLDDSGEIIVDENDDPIYTL